MLPADRAILDAACKVHGESIGHRVRALAVRDAISVLGLGLLDIATAGCHCDEPSDS